MPAATPTPAAALQARLQSLEVRARLLVEGFLAGTHRSPRHGFAVEFAEHREYAPGDDLRHVDWKVYGRADRLHLKQYELETNLVAWMLVDASESMRYGSGPHTKYDHAAAAALALSHMLVGQGDRVGLARFDDSLREWVAPSGRASHLGDLARSLAPEPRHPNTGVGGVLQTVARRIPARGVLFVFSDLLDEPDALRDGLRRLAFAKHDVVLVQMLDPAEWDFPFDGPTLFRGLENQPELLTDPRGVRDGYLAELKRHQDAVARLCRDLRVDHVPCRADETLGRTLAAYLARR